MAETSKRRKATPLQVARAVFWAFFGIRKRAAYEKDAVTLTIPQVVIAGIIGACLLILSLVLLVRFILS